MKTIERDRAGSTARVPDERLFKEMFGPLAVVRECLLCKFHTVVRKGLRGAGRGYGLREGNKARGQMIQHFKTAHTSEFEKLKTAAAESLARHLESKNGRR